VPSCDGLLGVSPGQSDFGSKEDEIKDDSDVTACNLEPGCGSKRPVTTDATPGCQHAAMEHVSEEGAQENCRCCR
jgi:hypothetical protein